MSSTKMVKQVQPSRPPKLAIVVSSFPGVSETFIVSKFLGLLAKGWDVHVVCSSSDQMQWQRYPDLLGNADARRRIHVTWPYGSKLLVAILYPWLVLRCLLVAPGSTMRYLRVGFRRFGLGVLKRFYLDADLIRLRPILIHFEFGPVAVERAHLHECLDCRILVSFRGYDLNYVGLDVEDYYRPVWQHADGLHCLGRDLWNRAQRRGCPSDVYHRLIPPAIDAEFFSPAQRKECRKVGSADRPLRIVSVASLRWKKGYEYSLDAVRLLMDQGLVCEYRIIGHGEYLAAVAFGRHQLGLEKAVSLLGAMPRTEVKEQLEWADVFLHGAVSEGFCNSVMEAQAMNLPVVCSDADGLAENVLDGKTGFVVPRRSPTALAKKLRILAESPDVRYWMGEAGRQRVLAHFRIEDQIVAFEELYHLVASSG